MFSLIGERIQIYESDLLDEFNALLKLITDNKVDEWNNCGLTADMRWVEIVKIFRENGFTSENLGIITEFSMSLPGTSAPVERVFSLMNAIRDSEKTQLSIDALTSMLIVRYNLELSCLEFFDSILPNKEFLRKVHRR